jgi:hypothetical protein
MANKAPDKIPPGPKLDALTAEEVFGWKNVHKHEGTLVGKAGQGREAGQSRTVAFSQGIARNAHNGTFHGDYQSAASSIV